MSSESKVGILAAEYLRFQSKADLLWVSRGLRPRSKDVTDGQQVEIPVPRYNRTVGTRVESTSREWKARCKRGRSRRANPSRQSEDVMRTELRVGKSVSHASRKKPLLFVSRPYRKPTQVDEERS